MQPKHTVFGMELQCVITYSPDASHNLLMIMLSRARRDDPVMTNKLTMPFSRLYASDMLDLNASSDDTVLVASVEDMDHFCLLVILGK